MELPEILTYALGKAASLRDYFCEQTEGGYSQRLGDMFWWHRHRCLLARGALSGEHVADSAQPQLQVTGFGGGVTAACWLQVTGFGGGVTAA